MDLKSTQTKQINFKIGLKLSKLKRSVILSQKAYIIFQEISAFLHATNRIDNFSVPWKQRSKRGLKWPQ